MGPHVVDGKKLSGLMEAHLADEVALLERKGSRPPGLGVILVGDNPASHAYVKGKSASAKKIGFDTFDCRLPATSSYEDVAEAISRFNHDSLVDGILLQLPLPAHLNSDRLIDLIKPEKDADGLHPLNQGLLLKGAEYAAPCTPSGVIRLLDWTMAGSPDTATGIPVASLAGKHAVVVGRSLLVGKPVSMMLLARNATVTMAHSKTKDLASVCRQADIIVAAVGVPGLIKENFVSDSAIVIDVGINRLPDGRLVGDVEYASVAQKVAAITPVPGGVGPMTVAMLMSNTLQLAKRFGLLS
jgi:methylenetetrahydrofolate dehydrogenase (NADP+)/methenyltetrahydrofolate cyclohydrolase